MYKPTESLPREAPTTVEEAIDRNERLIRELQRAIDAKAPVTEGALVRMRRLNVEATRASDREVQEESDEPCVCAIGMVPLMLGLQPIIKPDEFEWRLVFFEPGGSYGAIRRTMGWTMDQETRVHNANDRWATTPYLKEKFAHPFEAAISIIKDIIKERRFVLNDNPS